jgi:hypothetical protein
MLTCPRWVKRSQALRGRNLARDNPADGAPMDRLLLNLSGEVQTLAVIGVMFRYAPGHRTPEAMP